MFLITKMIIKDQLLEPYYIEQKNQHCFLLRKTNENNSKIIGNYPNLKSVLSDLITIKIKDKNREIKSLKNYIEEYSYISSRISGIIEIKEEAEQLIYEQYRNHQYHLKDSAQHSQFPELS